MIVVLLFATAKLRKASTMFLIPACVSFDKVSLGSHWTDVYQILFSSIISRDNSSFFKIWQE